MMLALRSKNYSKFYLDLVEIKFVSWWGKCVKVERFSVKEQQEKRIDEIKQGNVVRHDYTRVPYLYLTWCLLMMEIVESENDLCDDEYRQVATQQDFDSF